MLFGRLPANTKHFSPSQRKRVSAPDCEMRRVKREPRPTQESKEAAAPPPGTFTYRLVSTPPPTTLDSLNMP
ncbi:hypothetical protein E2C01_096125 [Portunus trituberculatus]|uniref:Uncharacterized protein n=1 Tax=Portunus trituberculatus TaxID=210409 RepID=A0A5B7K118_PORTR|nr:hypothetical protein [Portunus trituberculatus]